MEILGWILVGAGLFALTEGYYAIRRRGAAQGKNLWWLAALSAVAGLALVRLGLGLTG